MKRSASNELAGLALLVLAGCGAGEDPTPVPPPSAASGASASPALPFVDVTAASNIAYRVGYTRPSLLRRSDLDYQVTMMTYGGAAAGDCDGDGDIDLFITYGNTGGPDGGGGPNRLYLNQLAEQGNGLSFLDSAEQAGVANTRPDGKNNDRHSGPVFADLDGDGDLDLFLGGIHNDPSKIYENQGDCRFVDVTANSPDIVQMLAPHTLSAGLGDYDLDGDLDMFLTHWATPDKLYRLTGPRLVQTDHLWRNDSDASGIRFINASEETGVSDAVWLTRTYPGTYDFPFSAQDFDFTFTPTFARINNDLWPDIALAADFGTTQLLLNRGDGTFGSLENRILREAQFGMGSALGDIDHDGDLDWFVTSIIGPGTSIVTPHGNRLFRNDGGAELIADVTTQLGVADGAFGWGACFADLDNDADLDIFHADGYPDTFLTPNDTYQTDLSRAFVMNDTGIYTNEAGALGLAARGLGRGVVCADFDQDGDTDILELTDNPENSGRLWENRTAAAGRHFLRIRLEGLAPNTEAAGARIFARVGDTVQMREITIGSNYTSQNPTEQIFGLGAAQSVDELRIEWPALDAGSGAEQTVSVVNGPIAASQPGQTLVLRQPEVDAQ